ncbi:competence type IV pilus ATPase ComGA [Bacillus taeanensis]|uniref:Competence protein ComG n=1 Tax=Bacillus taeanensis TaxID=273032 RepID=A0A366XZL9_9BACI|nr:competence type IV pilus ATPase ComGA [Bacillus taeanensis]RBW70575.1 competence protein ComG [Bacillus taeanensis]
MELKSNQILLKALEYHASDMHFHPQRTDTLVQFRIDSSLVEVERMSKLIYERLISFFKFQAGMNIGEKRRPQTGSLVLMLENQLINLRLSTLPTPYLESLTLRILPQNAHHSLSTLSLFPTSAQKLNAIAQKPHGLILITGPTGSGKTTTLHAMLEAANSTKKRRIITIEDPIEKYCEEFIQVEVNEKAGVTYLEGFKALLRHDPDIIMIGEIRDAETAKLVVRAALTGHLVLSTVHTRDSIGALFRMLELGIPLQDLLQTLIAVVAQRLIEIACPFCKGSCHSLCLKMRQIRRLAVFEVLTEQHLSDVGRAIQSNTHLFPKFSLIKDQLKTAVSLGYINEKSYEWWSG